MHIWKDWFHGAEPSGPQRLCILSSPPSRFHRMCLFQDLWRQVKVWPSTLSQFAYLVIILGTRTHKNCCTNVEWRRNESRWWLLSSWPEKLDWGSFFSVETVVINPWLQTGTFPRIWGKNSMHTSMHVSERAILSYPRTCLFTRYILLCAKFCKLVWRLRLVI